MIRENSTQSVILEVPFISWEDERLHAGDINTHLIRPLMQW
jgi:hypothetical protein